LKRERKNETEKGKNEKDRYRKEFVGKYRQKETKENHKDG
jgi:hypothetical protein